MRYLTLILLLSSCGAAAVVQARDLQQPTPDAGDVAAPEDGGADLDAGAVAGQDAGAEDAGCGSIYDREPDGDCGQVAIDTCSYDAGICGLPRGLPYTWCGVGGDDGDESYPAAGCPGVPGDSLPASCYPDAGLFYACTTYAEDQCFAAYAAWFAEWDACQP